MPGLPCPDGQGGLWAVWQSQEATVALSYVQAQDYEERTIRRNITLEEAIKSLQNLEQHDGIHGWSASRDALKLGIEALKQIQRIRVIERNPDIFWLPGETSETA